MKKLCTFLLCITVILSCIALVSVFAETKTDFKAFDLELVEQGMAGKNFRFVVNTADFPFDITEDNLIGLTVKGDLITEDGKKIAFESGVEKVELRDSIAILVVPQTRDVTTGKYSDTFNGKHKWDLEFLPEIFVAPDESSLPPEPVKTDFEALDLQLNEQGMAGTNFRFVVNTADIPFEITEGNLKGLTVKGQLITEDQKEIPFESYVSTAEPKGSIAVLVVPQTKDVTTSKYSDTFNGKHSWRLQLLPELFEISEGTASAELEKEETYHDETCLYYFLSYDNFKEKAGWGTEQTSVTKVFYAGKDGLVAKADLALPYDGEFYIWARSRDFASDRPGLRKASLSIDGNVYKKMLGTHGREGYAWDLISVENLTRGMHEMEVVSVSNYFRFDMICITDDPYFEPSNKDGNIAEYVKTGYDASKVTPYEKPKPEIVIDPNRPDSEIAVKFNDTWMEFDVDPVIVNDRTLVPMRAIFEELGCEVRWDDATQTAIGIRNGASVMVTIGSNTAYISGEPVTIDQPPALINDRTMVPLRFISEAYNCRVRWEEETQSVYIVALLSKLPNAIYIDADGFESVGTWTATANGYIQGLSNEANKDNFDSAKSVNAVAKVNIVKAGKYNMWVSARDFPSDRPGTRTYHVAMDGVQSPEKMGDHGQEGFAWELAGTYELTKGQHTIELIDTSGFFARCAGIILIDDLDMEIPVDKVELAEIVSPFNPFDIIPMAGYPKTAVEPFEAAKAETIESETYKIVFYQGQNAYGPVVQHEIYSKNPQNGEWVLTKARNEEFGFMMRYALDSNYLGNSEVDGSNVSTTILVDGTEETGGASNYYKMGYGTWMIPSDFEKISDKAVKLTFASREGVNLTATYAFDDFVSEPKVTLDAKFDQKGSYSFMIFNGDGVEAQEFDTVTAPLLHLKHQVPEEAIVISEAHMFTPMNTLYFKADNNKFAGGLELTKGVAVDPTSTRQFMAHPDTAAFGTVFRTIDGKIRSSIVAPMIGNDCSKFEAGDTYTFSCRLISNLGHWYDTFEHVAVDMYNCTDLRTNYYGSINDNIYNTSDLIMTDFYSGWDEEWKGYYNMEGRNFVSQSNILSVAQRYLLSEDEKMLEERVVPTIAYAISRGSAHSAPTDTKGGIQYISPPSPLTGFTPLYDAAVYGGLYEMSQGRMPYLLDYAVNKASTAKPAAVGALYKYSGDETYLQKVIEIADAYLETYAHSPEKREVRLVDTFVYGDYITPTSILLSAYEITGEQKYLDKAEECGKLLMGAIWTTGYQNDFATNTIHLDPKENVERALYVDKAGFDFFWHGDTKWRLGNVDGEAKSAKMLSEEGIWLPEEDIPGWLATKTALGTEHASTPGHGNVITMNTWLGLMVRLAEYTGEDFFETQARNAMVGRFQNYPGYYFDRYNVNYMQADYPINGVDTTSLYWHHIPIYLSMVEDFLINEIWNKTNKNVEFPHIYQSGYAYFDSYQFGHAPGKFYDEQDMWLWLERDIITPDNINIDYIAAKKDGVVGLSLLNEDNKELTTTITLGADIGQNVTQTATVYDADGNPSTVEVTDGKFTVTIPSKGVKSVVLKGLENIKVPAYAREYEYSNEVGQTVSAHANGFGYTIQMTDDKYWAFTYITDMTYTGTKSATLTYTVDGKTEKITKTQSPFDWLIKVDNPDATFEYTIDVVKEDGTEMSYGGGTLKTLGNSVLKGTGVTVGQSTMPKEIIAKEPEELVENNLKFKAFDLIQIEQGNDTRNFRLVVSTDNFPFDVTADCLVGLKVEGELVDGDKKIPFSSTITKNEIRGNATVLVFPSTEDVKVSSYQSSDTGTHKFVLKLYPQE